MYDYGARYYDAALGRWYVIDPMHDRHYNYSPYAYVLNNPLLNIDLYGYTDWPTVLKGSATFVGGLGATVGGAVLVTAGVPAMGLGIGQIVDGIVNDGATDLPSGVGETVGMGIDAAIGDGSNTFENIGSVTDIAVSLVGGAPATAVEQVALGVQVVSTANDIVGTNDNSNTQTTGGTTTETTAASDNTSVSTNTPVENVDVSNVKVDEKFVNEFFEVK